jgi:hypothetical protein
VPSHLQIRAFLFLVNPMLALNQIEDAVKQLSRADQESLRDWLENFLEDQLEITDEFKAKIDRGEADIRAGRVRIHKA